MTEPVAVRASGSDPAPTLGGTVQPGQPATAASDAPGRRPASGPGSRAGVAGRSGGTCPGLVGMRYLVAVALLVALVWVPALIMIVAAHRSLPP